ncbi:hypothetical protein SAMN05660662_0142 [Blastococcus aurantiacus]|uniref:Uncharacterized protein n=1 Tax=Blastococcus aurantiacus TaxID=1550231 RepID=A0A1G7R232_9ACTN|nr:hypothetical protein [Blastococcus aurantiacus]SDG04832.1 hypothetical protein SAMN05660662_0142 [Blastococcus aurantiacus]
MRRAYISPHVDLQTSYRLAKAWAGSDSKITIVGSNTSALEASPWLAQTGLPMGTTSNRHSRYTAQARTGILIAWCLDLVEILNIERRSELSGLVVVRGHKSHSPWITAHDADLLGGEPVARVPEASPAIKAMVDGISLLPALNQGLIDSRERSMAVQALTYMRSHGHTLFPDQLAVEAIRHGWPGTSPLELADLAKQLNAGKRLRFSERLNTSVLAEWASM